MTRRSLAILMLVAGASAATAQTAATPPAAPAPSTSPAPTVNTAPASTNAVPAAKLPLASTTATIGPVMTRRVRHVRVIRRPRGQPIVRGNPDILVDQYGQITTSLQP